MNIDDLPWWIYTWLGPYYQKIPDRLLTLPTVHAMSKNVCPCQPWIFLIWFNLTFLIKDIIIYFLRGKQHWFYAPACVFVNSGTNSDLTVFFDSCETWIPGSQISWLVFGLRRGQSAHPHQCRSVKSVTVFNRANNPRPITGYNQDTKRWRWLGWTAADQGGEL